MCGVGRTVILVNRFKKKQKIILISLNLALHSAVRDNLFQSLRSFLYNAIQPINQAGTGSTRGRKRGTREDTEESETCPKNMIGQTPFHTACKAGHTKTAEMMILNSGYFKMDLNLKDNDGRTAFHLACSEGHLGVAELLIR